MYKNKILNLFSSPILLHYSLPVLMLCLVIGTIAQKYIGLYEATQIFFASPILWVGILPLPGLPLVLGLISLNLAGKLIFKSPWTLRNAGIILTHIGALLLMVGGLLTAAFSEEGFMDLAKGSKKNIVSDYHARELTIANFKINLDSLHKGQILEPYQAHPLKFEILDICHNCTITKRTNATPEFHSMAQFMELKPAPLKTTNEENMSGITFRVSGAPNNDENGVYVVLEDVPKHPEFHGQETLISVALQKSTRELPFSIELLDFKRDMYAGTSKAKSYESRVRIHDNGLQWESVISMNAPLRYKGYTFFQSSFIATPEGDISVLAVVWNVGRTFPYISSLAMCLGLLLHLFMRGRRA